MNEQAARLYQAAKALKNLTTQAEIARLLNVSSQVVKNWESRGISSRGMIAAQTALGVRADWLRAGEGEMALPPSARHEIALTGDIEAWDDASPSDPDDVEIPFYKEVELAAGRGSQSAVELNHRKLKFAKSTLRTAGVQIENAACALVTGNSMEPRIADGATIGIDRGSTTVKDGKIYALDHGGMLRVKYLYRLPGGGLRLHSENEGEHPDETYSGEQVEEGIRILGRVFWVSQLF